MEGLENTMDRSPISMPLSVLATPDQLVLSKYLNQSLVKRISYKAPAL